ncbi:MAG: hypothetical protein IPK07_34275 [Deltaproteobacteria bacterium]|nr:hypothetical protein [Deltaproteobacteria bacterium]
MATESGSDKIVCPKCGFQQYKRSAICKKCGLIFDKWREMQAKKQKAERAEMASAPESDEPSEGRRVSPVLIVLAVVALGGAAYSMVSRGGAKPPAPPPPQTATTQPAGPAGAQPPTGIQRRPSSPATTGGTAAPAAPGTPAAAGPRVRDPQVERYDAYKNDLGEAVKLLAGFEKKLKEGLDFKTMRTEFLDVRTAAARAFKEPPNEGWVSYQAVEKALNAYSDSLKFWEYRVYSADYRNRLWCAGEACPFQTEQDFKEEVGRSVNLCWDRASAFRQVAERYLQFGDALRLESDPSARQEVADAYKPVDEIWKKLGRPAT